MENFLANVFAVLSMVAVMVICVWVHLQGLQMNRRRRVAFMVGSDSDLKQCEPALEYLLDMHKLGNVMILGVFTNSIHRNTLTTLWRLIYLWLRRVDVIIIGAGWANHLSGVCEAFIRYDLRNRRIVVVPVAFDAKDKDKDKNRNKNNAATLSVSEVPSHQMQLDGEGKVCFGEEGALLACQIACGYRFAAREQPQAKPAKTRSIEAALAEVKRLKLAARQTFK